MMVTANPRRGWRVEIVPGASLSRTEAGREHRHPLHPLRVEPAGLAPLCDEASFAAIVERMVADEAPRLFAVVQEYGEPRDGHIAAWGLAFPDHTEVVSVHGLRLSAQTPQSVLRCFDASRHTRARLIWCHPVPATSSEDETTT